MARTAEAEGNRNLARDHSADADGDCVGGHVAAAGGKEVFVLTLPDVDAAAAGADHDAGSTLAGAQSRIAPRLACGNDTEQRGARIALRIRPAVLFAVTVEGRSVGDRYGRNCG